MKARVIEWLKHAKTIIDAWKIWIFVVGILSALGVGYVATDDPETAIDTPSESVFKEYSIKGHTHQITHPSSPPLDCTADIQKAIKAFSNQHDPRTLGH